MCSTPPTTWRRRASWSSPGEDQDEVAALLPQGCERAVQHQRLGTGDAVRAGMEPLAAFEGDVMVLYADVPLVDAAFVHDLLDVVTAARTAQPRSRRS